MTAIRNFDRRDIHSSLIKLQFTITSSEVLHLKFYHCCLLLAEKSCTICIDHCRYLLALPLTKGGKPTWILSRFQAPLVHLLWRARLPEFSVKINGLKFRQSAQVPS